MPNSSHRDGLIALDLLCRCYGAHLRWLIQDMPYDYATRLLGAGAKFRQQWGGINFIVYYPPVIFSSQYVSRRTTLVLSVRHAKNLKASTCVGAAFMESVGRKRLSFGVP
ncbi:uncharacterized protein P174DRAFT_435603 [Aspergillus novofumigatus IBT 16806]|uniref:Uncharacterized protein n=1 Tax=Aspergillus novofumigatus (strain IBT 16806) TaxID=1392255 RepID=A0A2I1BU07_ASPN1|nr:uncharacterized protein P174DRAFT_435603 [Aspergillus novofumigatus IBT 16806]PKX88887.1 hypothetical protein P174DRAFT_435603 [Aspergillus novofumigatus IBT 16806]